MPRGPGNKKGYNLDYSRFSVIDDSDDEPDERTKARAEAAYKDRWGAEERLPAFPSADDENLPKDLRDAMNIMKYSKMTGDDKAREKATELAMKAVEDGGPEVRAKFEEAVKMMMEKEGITKEDMDSATRTARGDGEGAAGELGGLKGRMQQQLEATQKYMDQLQKQQSQLESLQSPEDFFKFLHERGFSPEDMQRAMTDEEFGKELMEKQFAKDAANAQVISEDVMKEVESLSANLSDVLSSNDVPDGPASSVSSTIKSGNKRKEEARPQQQQQGHKKSDAGGGSKWVSEAPLPGESDAAFQSRSAAAALRVEEVEEDEQGNEIPKHRVQQVMAEDGSGKLKEIVVTVELPGVSGMAGVNLEVSARELRLSTTTAPFYALTATWGPSGPLTIPVDPDAAKAKFSKKKEELTVRLTPA